MWAKGAPRPSKGGCCYLTIGSLCQTFCFSREARYLCFNAKSLDLGKIEGSKTVRKQMQPVGHQFAMLSH